MEAGATTPQEGRDAGVLGELDAAGAVAPGITAEDASVMMDSNGFQDVPEEASSLVDTGTDANVGPNVSVDPTTQECLVDHRPCLKYTGFDQIGASLYEEPRYEADYDSGKYERLLRVTGPRKVYALGTSETHWQIEFGVESDRPSKGQLVFGGPKPLGVLSLPAAVRYRWNSKVLDCPVDFGEGRNEPVLLGQNSLRDASGTLLVAAGHAPLMSGGAALLAAMDVPELAVAWKEAGCAACPHAYAQERVALEFVVTETGKRATLLPGEDAMAEMSGGTYILSNRGTVRPKPDSAAFCGFAFWSIYRTDVYRKLNADGGAAMP